MGRGLAAHAATPDGGGDRHEFRPLAAAGGLIHALERLAQGEAVATVADALGYASPSGFIAMFRRAFGASPGRYFAQRQE